MVDTISTLHQPSERGNRTDTQKRRVALFVRRIGIARARAKIGLANLAYNMKRLAYLERREAEA